jgi:hypothetical protein
MGCTPIPPGAVSAGLRSWRWLCLGVHCPSDVAGYVFISGSAILSWLPVWNNLVVPGLSRSAFVSRWEDRIPTGR